METITEKLGIGPKKVLDLSIGEDVRGDEALFIELRHFLGEWELDDEVKSVVGSKLHFFRVIVNGVQKHQHGWIEKRRIIQWG